MDDLIEQHIKDCWDDMVREARENLEGSCPLGDDEAIIAMDAEINRLRAQLAERGSEAVGHIERRPIPDGIVPPGIIYTARLYDGSLPNGTMLYTTPQPPAVPDGYILIPEAPLKELIKKTGPLTLTDLSYTKFWQEVERAVLNSKTMLAERESEAVATLLAPDPYDERSGFWLDNRDSKRLAELPPGTKLYTTPQPAVPEWQPIDTAPKDASILVLHDHSHKHTNCAWCSGDETLNTLCTYHAFAEGLSSVTGGVYVAEWGGAFEESWEDGGGSLPDWWFRLGSEFEEPLNPTHWMPLPEPPTAMLAASRE